MSMNLHCNVAHLMQTPTLIAHMCMSTSEGLQYELKGIEAQGAINRYIAWVENRTNGPCDSVEELRNAVSADQYHIEEVKCAIENSTEELVVYIL